MAELDKSISVMALGLRGFPGVQGGIQQHCQKLYPLIVSEGVSVEAVVRSPYMNGYHGAWKGVRLRRLWCPKIKSLEAIVHSVLGVFVASVIRPDILHIHGIGPSLVAPLARLAGLRVVMTHHGPDYDRQKWGFFGRWSLKIGERLGVYYSHRCIAISKVIQDLIEDQYGKRSELIPNGVALPDLLTSTCALTEFNLDAGRYFIMVGRLVPEKRQLDVIKAFSAAAIPGWKLALIGEANHPGQYMEEVIALANATPGVVCTGFQTGESLAELYSHAGGFVLASSHEGHSVALLEALSYGLPAVVSDIPANLEVGLPFESYFPLGDIFALAKQLKRVATNLVEKAEKKKMQSWVTNRYSWRNIAVQTQSVFESVANGNRVG